MTNSKKLTILITAGQYEKLERLSAMYDMSKSQIIRAAAHAKLDDFFDWRKHQIALARVDYLLALEELGCQDYDEKETVEEMTAAADREEQKREQFTQSLKDAEKK